MLNDMTLSYAYWSYTACHDVLLRTILLTVYEVVKDVDSFHLFKYE